MTLPTSAIQHVYLITLPPAHQASPRQLNIWIRGHWRIENPLHWWDVTFQEDTSQTRTGVAPRVTDSLRNMAKANRYMFKHPVRPLESIGFTTPSATLHWPWSWSWFHIMAILRNIAITLLKHQGHDNIDKDTRKSRNYPN